MLLVLLLHHKDFWRAYLSFCMCLIHGLIHPLKNNAYQESRSSAVLDLGSSSSAFMLVLDTNLVDKTTGREEPVWCQNQNCGFKLALNPPDLLICRLGDVDTELSQKP